jgi:hypothetical protein
LRKTRKLPSPFPDFNGIRALIAPVTTHPDGNGKP